MVISSENHKGLATPSTSGHSRSTIVLEIIHQVLENLVGTYNINKTCVEVDGQILEILTAASFALRLPENRLKDYSPG